MVMLANQPPHQSASIESVSSSGFQFRAGRVKRHNWLATRNRKPETLLRIAIPVPAPQAREELNT
jgi:hypothetical protein